MDKVGIFGGRTKPIEFLVDQHLEFVEEGEWKIYKVRIGPLHIFVCVVGSVCPFLTDTPSSGVLCQTG